MQFVRVGFRDCAGPPPYYVDASSRCDPKNSHRLSQYPRSTQQAFGETGHHSAPRRSAEADQVRRTRQTNVIAISNECCEVASCTALHPNPTFDLHQKAKNPLL